jgi:hypothetical protein
MQKKIISINMTVLLIPILLLMPTLAMATNESSFKWGYKEAQIEYRDCLDGNAVDCGITTYSCFSPISTSVGDGTTKYHEIEHYDIMTNKTACMDGYIHSWNHICDPAKTNEIACPFQKR